MRWNNVIKNFEPQWKALKDRKENEKDVPKIMKTLTVMKWTESFPEFLSRVVGVRMIPLSYVLREHEDIPVTSPPLAPDQAHLLGHGSVEEVPKKRANLSHALYHDNNGKVSHYIEVATRSTIYVASIKPFQRSWNGNWPRHVVCNCWAICRN